MQANSCSTCLKNIRVNQKGLYWDSCYSRVHLKCTRLTYSDYNRLSTGNSNWFCPNCLISIFPFNSIEDHLDFLYCLYNYTNNNKLNPYFINNFFKQLKLARNLKLCGEDIDPDKHFYAAFDTARKKILFRK